ncbi:hypothetical protein BG22_04690 [Bifidobacterium sp. UTBIF-78]|nr:hypothetical protein BG22_04690 [Bifidobacterium sp. UTBIF-78]
MQDGIAERNKGFERNMRGELSPCVDEVKSIYVPIDAHIVGLDEWFPSVRLHRWPSGSEAFVLDA